MHYLKIALNLSEIGFPGGRLPHPKPLFESRQVTFPRAPQNLPRVFNELVAGIAFSLTTNN